MHDYVLPRIGFFTARNLLAFKSPARQCSIRTQNVAPCHQNPQHVDQRKAFQMLGARCLGAPCRFANRSGYSFTLFGPS